MSKVKTDNPLERAIRGYIEEFKTDLELGRFYIYDHEVYRSAFKSWLKYRLMGGKYPC